MVVPFLWDDFSLLPTPEIQTGEPPQVRNQVRKARPTHSQRKVALFGHWNTDSYWRVDDANPDIPFCIEQCLQLTEPQKAAVPDKNEETGQPAIVIQVMGLDRQLASRIVA